MKINPYQYLSSIVFNVIGMQLVSKQFVSWQTVDHSSHSAFALPTSFPLELVSLILLCLLLGVLVQIWKVLWWYN